MINVMAQGMWCCNDSTYIGSIGSETRQPRRLKPGASLLYLMLLAFAVMALFFVYPAYAQEVTGSIVGTVTDNTGAVIPGASVTIVNTDTQLHRFMRATSTGNYVFTSLPPGSYDVTVEEKGFAKY